MIDIDKQGIEFLNKLYKDMYKSDAVMHGVDDRFIGNKTDNISRYIDRMSELHERVTSSNLDNDLNILKEFYYRKYVIKEEDIPDSYYEHQKRMYLERGYGHVEFNDEEKHQMAMLVINDQKKTLDVWIEYFVSKDSSYIPMWAKYWAFQGMIRLGEYDKNSKSFNRRTKSTVSPFLGLNQEVLALSIDVLFKFLKKEEINDKDLEQLLNGGSFGKIYSHILETLLNKKGISKKSNDGKWVKYLRGSDYNLLVKSLQGYNTGWCTAGEATAKAQLSKGDFYVYYSYNEKGEAVIPRIAIRMEGNQIGEVRGVAIGQNIEDEMEEIVSKKLEEFPDKEKYEKKVSDMKKLTLIYNEYNSGRELTKEELYFLYQVKEKIDGFGYYRDPRINEIILKRNMVNDLNYMLENVDQFDGNLDLIDLRNASGVRFPKILNGDLDLARITSAKGLKLPKIITGSLCLNMLTSIEGLVLPEVIGGSLHLNNVKSIKGIKLPSVIGGTLNLSEITSLDGVRLPDEIGDNLYLTKLKSAKGLKLPEVTGTIDLSGLKDANGLILPKTINRYLNLSGLETAEGLELPKMMVGGLNLSSLKTINGLKLPETMDGFLLLSGLKDAKGLVLPREIIGDIHLMGLTNLDGITLPEKFSCIVLDRGIRITPENIHEYISAPKRR